MTAILFTDISQLFSLAMDGTTGAAQDNIRRNYVANAHSMMFYLNFFSSIYLLLGLILTGELLAFAAFVRFYPKVVLELLSLATASALGQVCKLI